MVWDRNLGVLFINARACDVVNANFASQPRIKNVPSLEHKENGLKRCRWRTGTLILYQVIMYKVQEVGSVSHYQ